MQDMEQESADCYRYLLLVVDRKSKFPFSYPLRTKKMGGEADVLMGSFFVPYMVKRRNCLVSRSMGGEKRQRLHQAGTGTGNRMDVSIYPEAVFVVISSSRGSDHVDSPIGVGGLSLCSMLLKRPFQNRPLQLSRFGMHHAGFAH